MTEDVAGALAAGHRSGRKRGHTYSEPDVLIAASALVDQLVVVSRDVGEFVEAGVPVLNPWTAELWPPGPPERTVGAIDREDLLEVIGQR